MNKRNRKTYDNCKRKARRHFQALLDQATASQVEQAAQWYEGETRYCQALADEFSLTLDLVTTYYAWTSIRQRLAQNKALTVQACHRNGNVNTIPAAVTGCRKAWRAWGAGDDPTATLTGRKTYNFARALQGDPEAVVIDVWMMRLAGFNTDAPTKIQYDAMEYVIRQMAGANGLEPRTLQALLWIIVRGGAA